MIDIDIMGACLIMQTQRCLLEVHRAKSVSLGHIIAHIRAKVVLGCSDGVDILFRVGMDRHCIGIHPCVKRKMGKN
jgi:hypothetical protein